jgi:hypothetical protein
MRAGVMCSAERPASSARRRAHDCIEGPITTRNRASTNSTGTTAANTRSGRCSSRNAPSAAPVNDAGICQRNRSHWPPSSPRYPQVADTPPATRPTALDIVDVTGG